MPWVRLDEEFPDHPKVAMAGPLASWLHVCALAYCNRYLTDGFVPRGQVVKLADFSEVKAKPSELASRLVRVGMWELADGGYLIHDYTDYQPSKAEVEAERKAKSEAGKKGAGSRWNGKPKAEPMANGMALAIAPAMTSAIAPVMAPPMAKRWPVPVPVPDRESSSSVSEELPAPKPADDEDDEELEAEIQRRFAASRGAGTKIVNVKAWKAKARANLRAEIAELGRSVLVPPKPPPGPFEDQAAAAKANREHAELQRMMSPPDPPWHDDPEMAAVHRQGLQEAMAALKRGS